MTIVVINSVRRTSTHLIRSRSQSGLSLGVGHAFR